MSSFNRTGCLHLHPQGSENTVSMMEAGMIPNVVDYYDVDTDPTGQFVPRLACNCKWWWNFLVAGGVFFETRKVGWIEIGRILGDWSPEKELVRLEKWENMVEGQMDGFYQDQKCHDSGWTENWQSETRKCEIEKMSPSIYVSLAFPRPIYGHSLCLFPP